MILKILKRYIYIIVYLCISNYNEVYFRGKPIRITVHAIKRARQRDISYPDQIYKIIKTGKIKTYGKNGIKFISKKENGLMICIAEETSSELIIRTIERDK